MRLSCVEVASVSLREDVQEGEGREEVEGVAEVAPRERSMTESSLALLLRVVA